MHNLREERGNQGSSSMETESLDDVSVEYRNSGAFFVEIQEHFGKKETL
jgi:hypothetical protein